ncbi:hypothetical protein COLO4_21667 [Corchorus olitorius]|uniref:Uncharacterized protein n=1 Tax=Corchorus olitorius TaxID=93759 RepID=A0A1R3IRU0_9ROSI|nr:hypothetical protein COLO4_21667 [Corchorus olitorius]
MVVNIPGEKEQVSNVKTGERLCKEKKCSLFPQKRRLVKKMMLDWIIKRFFSSRVNLPLPEPDPKARSS